ncbi:MAG: hypothetical protein GY895_04615 [Phycisphaera sp.]|nr:hypothetical protein [Phycisphaera sp.]
MTSFSESFPASAIISVVHVAPVFSVPIAIGLALVGAWYWRRMGRGSIPPIRRRLRRIGLLLGAMGGLLLMSALSFIDPVVKPAAYVTTWFAVLFVVLAAVVVAGLDAIATLRLHQKSVDRLLMRDALKLRGAVDARRRDPAGDADE